MGKQYLCGVPLCGREATQVVHFYSDTHMLIRGMEAIGKEGQHEFFCEQCYHQAGFNSQSDITAIPVCDFDEPEEDNYPDLDGEVDYGCDCADCEVTNCHGECWQ